MPKPISPQLAALIRAARAKYSPHYRTMLCRRAALEALDCAYDAACFELEYADIATGEDVQDMMERLCANFGFEAMCAYLESEAANYNVT
jgi:hypothetical protein